MARNHSRAFWKEPGQEESDFFNGLLDGKYDGRYEDVVECLVESRDGKIFIQPIRGFSQMGRRGGDGQ